MRLGNLNYVFEIDSEDGCNVFWLGVIMSHHPLTAYRPPADAKEDISMQGRRSNFPHPIL